MEKKPKIFFQWMQMITLLNQRKIEWAIATDLEDEQLIEELYLDVVLLTAKCKLLEVKIDKAVPIKIGDQDEI